ncbi:MAG: ABC transporter substrate-binding protein [Bacteriovoracaceae bacterium]|jgi:oligopeptide transport system substrate-binding protein
MKLFGVILLAVSFLVGCSKEQNFDERVIYLVSPEKVAGFDPINASDMYSSNEMGKVYEGLFEFHPLKRPYELMPNLAAEMPTVGADGLTYTVKIKKGVFFHDSPAFKGQKRELKADDFVYSIKRLADPKLMAKGWWVLDDKLVGLNEWRTKYAQAESVNYADEIEGLKKIDDYTIQFKLKQAFPQFLYALAMPYTFVVPKEAVEHFGKEFLNHPVGTGAFILPKFEQTNRITYEKNPNFREKFYPSEGEESDVANGLLADAGKKLPLVDKIIVDIIVEAQPKWLGFKRAKNDLLEVPKDNFEEVIVGSRELTEDFKSKGIRLHAEAQLDVTFISFNNQNDLFKDNKKLRQAISLAYNRAQANKLFYNDTAIEAQGVIPPGISGYRKEFKNPYTKYDVDLAKKLLKEAGYPEGKGLPALSVETRNDTSSRQILEQFADNMKDIGIKVIVSQNTWPELVNKVTTKRNQMYTMAWGADYPDAENFLGLLYCPNQSPGSNGANYCNPEFDKLYKQAVILQDSPERTALYEKINEMVALEVPWIFSFHRTKYYVAHAWLKNYKFMEFNHTQFQYFNVDLEVKKQLSKKF